MTIRDKETRIADNIRLILKNSKTVKETQEKLKVNFISDDWRIIDLYSIDDYIRKIFGKTDNNRCKEKIKELEKEFVYKFNEIKNRNLNKTSLFYRLGEIQEQVKIKMRSQK